MDEQLVLKNRLKVARAERGLSQGDLAKLVGVSRQTISSIETGQFNPTAKLALLLCIALDWKFEDLFYFTEAPEKKKGCLSGTGKQRSRHQLFQYQHQLHSVRSQLGNPGSAVI